MIKINLATRKQTVSASAVDAGSGGGGDALAALKKFQFNADDFKELPIFLIILCLVVAYVASAFLDSYKQDALAALDTEITQVQEQQARLKGEVAKTKGYKDIKKQLDADELQLKTKIGTIQKLLDDRVTLSKLLVSLSENLPKEVWLTEFKIQDSDVIFKGASRGFIQVSDFLKNLGENIYFRDLSLKGTQEVADPTTGANLTIFELEAKRR